MSRGAPKSTPGASKAAWRSRGFALAGTVAALLLFFGMRLEPPPERGATPKAPRVRWGGGEAADAERCVGDPTLFAFESPVGFTRDLARERLDAQPPRRPVTPPPPPAARPPERRQAAPSTLPPPPPLSQLPAPNSRLQASNSRLPTPNSSLLFSDGWEARLFAGLNLDYPAWLAEPWEASADLLFDASGVPVRAILATPSPDPGLNARLVRELWKLRLRDPAAPRAGTLRWRVAVPAMPPVPSPEAA